MPELDLGRIGYGAANLGNLHRALSDAEARDILEEAWALGIRYFDTAPHYGLGLSERRLGEFLRDKPRDGYVLSTKVGRLLRPVPDESVGVDLDSGFHVSSNLERVWDPSEAGVRASLTESLDRLGVERVDILFLHDPERYDLDRGLAEALPALAELRDEGLVTSIGVGSMSTNALLQSARTGLVDLLMVAGRYTLAEQPVFPEVLEACRDNGVGIVNASVFNSGLLARSGTFGVGRYDYGDVPADVLARVTAIAAVCEEFAVELPAAALQFAARDPLVRSVVVGASRPSQLAANVAAFEPPIPDAFWARLADEGLVPRR